MDPLGPLVTLQRLLFSSKSLTTFLLFITQYWYTVILAALAVMGLMITIVKLCGKKTPLLERRKRRRRRSVHHEGGEVVGVGPMLVQHPTAVKSSLPFMGRSYRLEREARRREKEEKKTRRKSGGALEARKVEEGREGREGAAALAANLTQRLVVTLPPEPRPGPLSAPLTIDSRRISSEEARSAVSSWLDTVSAEPEPQPLSLQPRVEKKEEKEKKKRSKSVNKPQEKDKEGATKVEKHGRGRKKREEDEKEEEEEEQKGVTIAKLGPFTMSMELKGAGGGVGSGGRDKEKDATKGKVRSRSRSKPGEDRTRRKSRKEDDTVEKVVAKPAEDVKEPEVKVKEESKKTDSRRKERIVVSKLARSDRPLRERSPEKPRKEEKDEDEDYRATLNRRREKFTRSVSQPGPQPSLDFLIPAVTTTPGLGNRNRSFTGVRPVVQGLRRSNTLQEEVVAGREDSGVFDNLGYDRSPDLRTGARAAEKRQQTLAAIKDQIQEQLSRASGSGPAHSLPSTGGRRRKDPGSR